MHTLVCTVHIGIHFTHRYTIYAQVYTLHTDIYSTHRYILYRYVYTLQIGMYRIHILYCINRYIMYIEILIEHLGMTVYAVYPALHCVPRYTMSTHKCNILQVCTINTCIQYTYRFILLTQVCTYHISMYFIRKYILYTYICIVYTGMLYIL